MLNRPEWIEAMLGAYRARVAPFNVNYRYVDDELLYLLVDSDCAALVYEARYAPTLARLRDRLPKLKLLLQVADESGEPLLPGALDYEAALASASAAPPPVMPSPDDLYILYTGGTTGAPKGVLWRQEDIYHAAMTGGAPGLEGVATYEGIVEQARSNGGFMRIMATPPLMHGAAQWVSFGALHQGGTVCLQGRPEKLDPADVLGTVERERCNMLTLVGDAFARPILDHLKTNTYDLSGVFVIGSGGAILSPHFKQALLEHVPHAMVVDGFGASETGAQGSHATKAGDTAETGKFAMTTTVVLKNDLSGRLEPGSDRDRLAREARPRAARLLQGRREDREDVPRDRRHALRGARRPRADPRRRHADRSRTRLGLHQLRRREDLSRGGRAGAAQARGRRRRHRRRHTERAIRRTGDRGRAAARRRDARSRDALDLRRAVPRALQAATRDRLRRRDGAEPVGQAGLSLGEDVRDRSGRVAQGQAGSGEPK
jgi:acyl-CoA synthetase (AMP-forming)/AMP-acid ligase II